MNAEQYFHKIETPLYKRGVSYPYHLIVSIDQKKKIFVANFLSGIEDFYYKKNITAKTLNELMKKVYKLKGRTEK